MLHMPRLIVYGIPPLPESSLPSMFPSSSIITPPHLLYCPVRYLVTTIPVRYLPGTPPRHLHIVLMTRLPTYLPLLHTSPIRHFLLFCPYYHLLFRSSLPVMLPHNCANPPQRTYFPPQPR